ncbi:MAG: class I SAM-dependent methyltransferase [Candidatus Eisenbacteria bacterium]|uniref:Class I SAM-dependent methyltransferase n=1 Tax=Eiseniibacteriota bacterium TaxID=2212470 RepID=A0A7Y2H1N8_UNCEI|nr:class I SAM-dependent methyltransferase [Candidatus Eisenbacteria bacterium]
MKRWVRDRIKGAINMTPKMLCKYEFEKQKFHKFNERPIELKFVFDQLSELYPKTILDVGTGTTALPHLMRNCGFVVTAIDNISDYWPAGMANRHYHVIDDDITKTKLTQEFDFVTCISVLEHIENPDDAMRNMVKLLKPGGHLALTVPYNEKKFCENVYELPESANYGRGNPYKTSAYSRAEVDQWLAESPMQIAEQQYWQVWDGEFWTTGNPVYPPKLVTPDEPHSLSCLLFRKNG